MSASLTNKSFVFFNFFYLDTMVYGNMAEDRFALPDTASYSARMSDLHATFQNKYKESNSHHIWTGSYKIKQTL